MTYPKPKPKQSLRQETPAEWADRVLAEHGPPPQRLVDHVRRLRREVADQTAAEMRTGETHD